MTTCDLVPRCNEEPTRPTDNRLPSREGLLLPFLRSECCPFTLRLTSICLDLRHAVSPEPKCNSRSSKSERNVRRSIAGVLIFYSPGEYCSFCGGLEASANPQTDHHVWSRACICKLLQKCRDRRGRNSQNNAQLSFCNQTLEFG